MCWSVHDCARSSRARRCLSRRQRPSGIHLRKLAEIERLDLAGTSEIGRLTDREFMLFGVALYLGEGFKRDGPVGMANTDPEVLRAFVNWSRRFFRVDESRLRVRIYLHNGLDLAAAECFWSDLLDIPRSQFRKPYRAAADPTRRHAKHVMGCPSVTYCCTATHRRVMGLVRALSSSAADPG